MEIERLISNQKAWEAERGIVNGNDNLNRTQVELDEAFEETDAYKRLVEMCDVLIILSGGMAKICEKLDLPHNVVSSIIEEKLEINEHKYPQEVFDAHSPETAVSMCRHYWKVDPDEWEGGGDVY
jgi:hypothetical protein